MIFISSGRVDVFREAFRNRISPDTRFETIASELVNNIVGCARSTMGMAQNIFMEAMCRPADIRKRYKLQDIERFRARSEVMTRLSAAERDKSITSKHHLIRSNDAL